MTADAAGATVEEYLRLGLRFGRLVDGYVDCWTGGERLRAEVAAEPVPDPADLARRADTLRAGLDGLPPQRRDFLDGQLRALACAGRRLAGIDIGFVAEVEEYFDVHIEPADPQRYAELHAELGSLLPGPGPLAERVAAFCDADRLAGEDLRRGAEAMSAALRERVAGLVELPAGEHVELVLTADKPWNAFNEYRGGFRSRISLNADVGHRMTALPFVMSHEAYPGHHTEHCVKDAELCRRRGQREHAISLVNTPQALLAEGAGETALAALVGPGWGAWTEAVLAPAGLRLDGELAERVEALTGQLLAARQDAALLLHDRGASQDEVVAYLGRWMLVTEARARQMLRFLTDPLWRAYTTTYIEGKRLVGGWLAAGEAWPRYARLIAEPLTPAALRART
ncbi:DUF885 domain-containing protein [Dactylosporangium sp. CA-139066]|uniref:DUF885 domain-containing protein n=1 Tax=Dactylosporangium sp. CA-139066 TaxID=3239930 RepID=UPI003D92E8F3